MEVKSLYEAHEAELLKDRAEVDVTGLDEEQAKEAVKKDYEERREIMDASPIHVAIAGRMMFKRVMGKASFCNIQDLQKEALPITLLNIIRPAIATWIGLASMISLLSS